MNIETNDGDDVDDDEDETPTHGAKARRNDEISSK